ncbi:hypothetical protein ACWA2B_10370 [Paenibacillus sp. CMM36]
MSYQRCTSDKEEVSNIVKDILQDGDHLNTEILIYFDEDDKEWTIIKDKRFFSYGLKFEDKLAHLENLIEMCSLELKDAEKVTSVDEHQCVVNDLIQKLNVGMLKYKNNEIEWSE